MLMSTVCRSDGVCSNNENYYVENDYRMQVKIFPSLF